MPKKIKAFDILIPLIPILLLVVSISVIYSLVVRTSDANLVMKQVISGIIGFSVMLFVSFVDYRFFKSINWIFYVVSILLLIFVDLFGKSAGGAMRWINLGFFQLQPSEIAKISIIIFCSAFFNKKIGNIKWKDLIISLIFVSLPLALILKEPDMGTALVVVFTYIGLVILAKPTKAQLATIFLIILLASTTMVLSAKNVKPFGSLLHDYQRNRILTFIDPDMDPYGKGYNVRQAQITVGSGGFFGKGLGRGSQSQLQFLPKPQTDFIFSGIAESFGFIGMIILITAFAVLCFRIISIGVTAQDNFGMLICFGTALMFFFQIFVNIGMNVGLVPVTGIPLPFSSYGGSALVSYFFILGIIESIFIRHKKLTF